MGLERSSAARNRRRQNEAGRVLRDPGQALPAYKEDEVSKSAREVQEHYDSVVAILGAFREENREWDTRPEVASSVLIFLLRISVYT